jgi:pyrroline-5-carboxylate reductase
MSANSKKIKIGIIGCGHMGTCFAKQLGVHHELFLTDRTLDKAKKLGAEVGASVLNSNAELVKQVEVIILAIKPQNLGLVADEIKEHLNHSQLLVSILAGVPISRLKHYFGKATLLRMMPNMALKYGKGVIGLAEHEILPHEIKKKVDLLFSSFGFIHWLPEEKMDALTALTGSGLAFAFVMIEAMADAAITMGFSSSQALQMVIEMLTGAVMMLEKTQKHPAELKWQVSSPAGTTIEGLNCLEQENVRYGIISAFLAAYERAKQLSKHPPS